MKIAIIGNMNNNGFSLMRYLSYLGYEAHLFLFQNDGQGPFAHFKPENDTWEYEKWNRYIHRMKISNGYRGIIGYPEKFKFPFYSSYLKNLFKDFDKLIGTGISPAVFSRAGLKLDIFYPYSMGIEYVKNIPTVHRLKNANFFIKLLCQYTKNLQIKGIKESHYCLNFDLGLTQQTFDEIDCDVLNFSIPMVYNLEKINLSLISNKLKELATKIEAFDLSILSHSRHLWVKNHSFSNEEWYFNTKNNDWLIKGFSKIVKEINKKSLLILLEYGENVLESKQLISDLEIEENVLWLPKMSRKEIMFLLNLVDIGVGEFYNVEKTIWGGTGWEVLASGKPLLQSFRFKKGEFEKIVGYPEPDLLNVLNEEDIFYHLSKFFQDKNKYTEMGKKSQSWFHNYNGLKLAKKWANLLNE